MKKSTERVLLVLTSLCLLLLVLVAAAPTTPNALAQQIELPEIQLSDVQQIAALSLGYCDSNGVSISFTLPSGWHTKTARVRMSVTDRNNVGIYKVEAKAVQNGSWADITDTLYLDITDNCTVYVQVTDFTGTVTTKSVYVECFDRDKPTVRASRSGRLLRIEASDGLSGIESIYVDGVEYTDHTDGTLEVRINTRDNPDEKIWIQARDYAGNLSSTYTMTNPYYNDPDDKGALSSDSGNSTTDTLPDGSGTTTESQTEAPASTTGIQEDGATSTSSGTGESGDGENKGGGVIAIGDKQFITIETRDEHIFYLIIDSSSDSDNVYLVTEATTRDLLSFTRDEAIEDDSSDTATEVADTGTGGGTPSPDADVGTLIDGGTLPSKDGDGMIVIDDGSPTESTSDGEAGEPSADGDSSDTTAQGEEAGKKGNPLLGWIVIAILLVIAAFASYMFLVVLPRKKAKEAFIEDEDDTDEDEYIEPYDMDTEEPDEAHADDTEDTIVDVDSMDDAGDPAEDGEPAPFIEED